MPLIPPVHTRDGFTLPPSNAPAWDFAAMRREQRRGEQAHEMFVAAAHSLDGVAHIITRSGLDVDALLEEACRATNPWLMRNDIAKIARDLELQAMLLESVAWLRECAPHTLPADDKLAWRPVRNLEFDARCLRFVGGALSRRAAAQFAQVDAPVHGPQQAYTVVFRNAINGTYETHGRNTRDEAEDLAATYRPFNNTAATIEAN